MGFDDLNLKAGDYVSHTDLGIGKIIKIGRNNVYIQFSKAKDYFINKNKAESKIKKHYFFQVGDYVRHKRWGVGKITDLDENLVFVNDAFAKMLKYDLEELQGKSVMDLVFEEDQEKLRSATASRVEGISEAYEIGMIRKDNKRIMVRVSAVPRRDEDNNVTGSIAVVIDITGADLDGSSVIASLALDVRYLGHGDDGQVGIHLGSALVDFQTAGRKT